MPRRRCVFSIENTRITLRPVVAITAATVALLMLQPHLGASIIVAAVALTFYLGFIMIGVLRS